MLTDLLKLLEGKKTYLVALVAAALGIAQAFGYVVPEYIYVILGALGLTTTRQAIARQAVAAPVRA